MSSLEKLKRKVFIHSCHWELKSFYILCLYKSLLIVSTESPVFKIQMDLCYLDFTMHLRKRTTSLATYSFKLDLLLKIYSLNKLKAWTILSMLHSQKFGSCRTTRGVHIDTEQLLKLQYAFLSILETLCLSTNIVKLYWLCFWFLQKTTKPEIVICSKTTNISFLRLSLVFIVAAQQNSIEYESIWTHKWYATHHTHHHYKCKIKNLWFEN